MGCGLSKTAEPRPLVARLLPGWNTLLQTFSLRAAVGDGVVGVVGVVGVPGLAGGIDKDLWNLLLLLPSPSPSLMLRGVEIFLSLPRPLSG